MTNGDRLLAVLLASAGFACDPDASVGNAPAASAPAPTAEGATDGVDAQPPAPLERSTKKNLFPAKGALHLGYNLDALAKLYALAAALEIPEWGASGEGELGALRDDDLATAWICTASAERPCAIGLHFPAPASIKAVRIHAGGPLSEPHGDHPRIARLRVHTDEGWVEATLPDEPGDGHVVLGKEVTSSTLVLEVVALRAGKRGQALHVGEVEVYGSRGEARPAWTFDPALTFVSHASGWTRGDDGHALPGAVVTVIDADGHAHPFTHGTALFGGKDDRVLLLERIVSSSCARHLGSYALVDRRTRVIVPLGDLGGVPATVWRAAAGSGWAVGRADAKVVRLGGAFADDDGYSRRRTARLLDRPAADVLAEWKLEPKPSRRGGAPLRELPSGCVLGSDDLMTALAVAKREPPAARPGEWLVCELGGGAQMFVTDHGPCGSSWEIDVLDRDGKLVATAGGARKGSRARLRRIDEGRIMVEIGGKDDGVELHLARSTGLVAFGRGSALAIDPPAACRSRCDTRFAPPLADAKTKDDRDGDGDDAPDDEQ